MILKNFNYNFSVLNFYLSLKMVITDKKILLRYPSVSCFLEFLKETEYTPKTNLTSILDKFFMSDLSQIKPNINHNNFNILVINTASKSISANVKNLIYEYDNIIDRITSDIKIFVIDHIYQIDVIGQLPQIEYLLNIGKNKFDIVLCQSELCDCCAHLKQFIKYNGILVTDNQLNIDDIYGWNFIRSIDSFHLFSPNINDNMNTNYNINNSDITMSEFLDYNTKYKCNNISIDEILRDFINHKNKTKVNIIELSKNYFNILVICSSTPSIKSDKYKSIIKNFIGNNISFTSDINVYHLGKDIYETSDNNIFRGVIYNLIVKNSKFNIIISDGCPLMIINSDIDHIKDILLNDGILIVKGKPKINSDDFEIIYSSDYTTLMKK
jgi:hypothetical protein